MKIFPGKDANGADSNSITSDFKNWSCFSEKEGLYILRMFVWAFTPKRSWQLWIIKYAPIIWYCLYQCLDFYLLSVKQLQKRSADDSQSFDPTPVWISKSVRDGSEVNRQSVKNVGDKHSVSGNAQLSDSRFKELILLRSLLEQTTFIYDVHWYQTLQLMSKISPQASPSSQSNTAKIMLTH